jgi:hypothetical protein
MAVKNLESLVLRGSAVLLAGKSGNPRLGSGFTAEPKTPEIAISMRRPSHLGMQEFQPAKRPHHADYCRVDALVAFGAGRSLRCAGVLSRSCPHQTRGTSTTLDTVISAVVLTVVGKRRQAGMRWCKPSATMRTALA